MKTKSEALFERFLIANNLPFEKIKEDTAPSGTRNGELRQRPDYMVSIGGMELVFELKELAKDKSFEIITDPARPDIKSSSRIVGDHVRRRIERAKKQIQYGARRGMPSVLLIYNELDPVFQMFGTEAMDFIAAMYGEHTIVFQQTRPVDWFNGNNQFLQKHKNTSFSAVGHLCDRGGTTTVTLFENIFAEVKIPYDQLPPCFNVPRIELSTNPA